MPTARLVPLVVGSLSLVALITFPLACAPGENSGANDGEICGDGVDNDNDGAVDEGVDEDGDTYRTCDIPELIDCDDDDPDIHPGTDELCDGQDTNCDGEVDNVDLDDDGYISADCGGTDCNDANANAYPGHPEACDGADNDCDGEVDNGFDADDDGFTFCAGDCVDSDPLINPDAPETCDGLDNNCNCSSDSNEDGITCGPGDTNVDEDYDADGDGFVDATDPFCVEVYGPGGAGESSGDCNDDPDDGGAAVHPGAHEDSFDQLDNDCDGCTDECQDEDGDGWDTCDEGAPGDATCPAPQDQPDDGLARDCDDSPDSLFAPFVNPGASFEQVFQDETYLLYEQCNGVDDNCDGCIDEGFDPATCNPLEDFDRDNPGPCQEPVPED